MTLRTQALVAVFVLSVAGCGDDSSTGADSGFVDGAIQDGAIELDADAGNLAEDSGLDASPSVCSDWTSEDLGEVGLGGTWHCDETGHTVEGAGDDIWGGADSFRFTHRTLTGDGTLIARLNAFTATDEWAKAGIMMRSSLDADSAHVHLLVSNGEANPVKYDARPTTGANTDGIRGRSEQAPLFLRLQRLGDTYRAHTSLDGSDWVYLGEHEVELGDTLFVGLSVLSQETTELAEASFDQVSLVAGTSAECSESLACAPEVMCEAGVCAAPPAPTGDYYVSPSGDDSNPGTLEEPFATLDATNGVAEAGDLILIRGGLYREPVTLRASGTSGEPIRYEAFPGERAVFRGEGRGATPHVEQIRIEGSWIILRGVWVEESIAAGVRVFGDHVHLDALTIRQSGTTGINFWTNVGGIVSNSVISESYNQFGSDGSPEDGGGADGISFAHCTDGLITNTIAWGNSDDGYDLWGSSNTRIEHSFAFGNGINRWGTDGFNGDGNGFKMGNCDSRGNESHRNISFSHPSRGYDDNCAQETTFTHCSSFDDGTGFSNRHASNVWINNAGFMPRRAMVSGSVPPAAGSNAWDLDIELSAADFISVAPPELTGEESAAEALALLRASFLRPSEGSALIDRGEDLGEASEGEGPDLGAYEF